MEKDISLKTTNLQSIEMSSHINKNSKHFFSKDKPNSNLSLSLQMDEMKNTDSGNFQTSPKPNQVILSRTYLFNKKY